MTEKYYKVREQELRNLLVAELKLTALQSGGADNWDYYCDSLNEYLGHLASENEPALRKMLGYEEDEEIGLWNVEFEDLATIFLDRYYEPIQSEEKQENWWLTLLLMLVFMGYNDNNTVKKFIHPKLLENYQNIMSEMKKNPNYIQDLTAQGKNAFEEMFDFE